jgi:hypothetical protein
MKTDLSEIFLGAIEKNNCSDVKVYLLNTSTTPKTLLLLQGSFQGDVDGLMNLGSSPYKEITVPAMGFVQIDHMDDAGQLDFTTHYTVKDKEHEYVTQINGWSFFHEDKLVELPFLKERGYLSGFGLVGKY